MKKLSLILAMLLLSATCYGWSSNDYTTEDKAKVDLLTLTGGTTGDVLTLQSDGSWAPAAPGTATMVYPGAGIAVSTGSAWDTSITNNSANWNTAYGWGDHASAGYVTGTPWTAMGYLTAETDPSALKAADIGTTVQAYSANMDTDYTDDFTWDFDYADLQNTPAIPSALSELSGDSDDITEGTTHFFDDDGTDANTTYTAGTGMALDGTTFNCTVVDTNTTYAASYFDIKDLTDSTNLRTAWSAKLDSEVDGSTTNELQVAATVPVTTTGFNGNFSNDASHDTEQELWDILDDLVFGGTQYGYITLPAPHSGGVGLASTPNIDFTTALYAQAKFADDVDVATNYVEYRLIVPEDMDTSADIKLESFFVCAAAVGTDTSTQQYVISMDVVGSDKPYDGTCARPVDINLTETASTGIGDALGTITQTTLTDWKTDLASGEGKIWVIRIARDGDDATYDTSTIDTYTGPLTISYTKE